MKNKRGFTLVELLAVIAILAIILTIVVSSVTNTISTSKDNLHDQQAKQLENSARMWYLESDKDLSDNESCKISVSDIISDGYIEGNDVIDPKTGETMKGYVEIKHTGKQYTYTYNEASSINDCKN